MKTVLRISIFMAIIAIAAGCKKNDGDDDQLRIIFTDIPAEYNGMNAQSFLSEPYDDPYEGYIYASGGIFEDGITNGKATIYYTGSFSTPFTRKGEYIVSFYIRQDIGEGMPPPIRIFHWGGKRLINITKTTTTISFNTLQIHNQTYPFTVGGEDEEAIPQNITITDIPAEHSDKDSRRGYVYLLKPDDRELYAYSYGFGISDGKTTPNLQRASVPPHDIEKGRYIVVFKIKENRAQGETIYWEGESEPMDITKQNTTISLESLQKWDRTYPYTTDHDEVWTDR